MDEERNGASFVGEVLRIFFIVFSLAVLAISFAGMLLARYAPDAQAGSSIFSLDGAGLPYSTIMQIAAYALIMAVFYMLIFSDRFIVKVRFLWRFPLLFLATFLIGLVFAIIFKWFPVDSRMAWIRFVLATVISFTISFCLTLLKIKLEGKKYDKLLANYKARQKE